jgi:hypothetical protein
MGRILVRDTTDRGGVALRSLPTRGVASRARSGSPRDPVARWSEMMRLAAWRSATVNTERSRLPPLPHPSRLVVRCQDLNGLDPDQIWDAGEGGEREPLRPARPHAPRPQGTHDAASSYVPLLDPQVTALQSRARAQSARESRMTGRVRSVWRS